MTTTKIIPRRTYRRLPCAQCRGFYAGAWKPHIVEWRGGAWTITDEDAYGGPEARPARAEDWATTEGEAK